MKKLVSICLVICLIGGAFALGGLAAGGVLYGSYYHGRFYPIRDAIREVAYDLRHDLDWDWDWNWDDDWEYDYGYDYNEHARSANSQSTPLTPTAPAAASRSAASVEKLELDLGRGSFRLIESDDFSVSGGKIEESEQSADKWHLKVRSKLGRENEEIVIGIPAAYYKEIEIGLGASSLNVEVPLSADEIQLAVGAASMNITQPLDATDLELAVGAGSVTAVLAGAEQDYGWEATTAGGSISINDTELLSGLFGSTGGRRSSAPRQMEIALGAGSVELFTAE